MLQYPMRRLVLLHRHKIAFVTIGLHRKEEILVTLMDTAVTTEEVEEEWMIGKEKDSRLQLNSPTAE